MTVLLAVLIVAACGGCIALGWILAARGQRSVLDAASTVAKVAGESAEKILQAHQHQIEIREHLKDVHETLAQMSRSTAALAKSVDHLDIQQGSILNALVNSGLFKSADAGPPEQYGERRSVSEAIRNPKPPPLGDSGERSKDDELL